MLDSLGRVIAAFPFHSGDVQKAVKLLEWIGSLQDGCMDHTALLVADAGVEWGDVVELTSIAEKAFSKVCVTATESSVMSWPKGPNSMFMAAAEFVEKELHEPFFFCETDCVPLKAGWLDSLDRAYRSCGRPFMGALVSTTNPNLPRVSLAGVAVYPPNAASLLRQVLEAQSMRAWDVASAAVTVPQSAHTPLIQHFWGQPQLPPTFAERKWLDSPVNTFTLSNLNKDAVVFHRNKDGTLIRLLQMKVLGKMHPKITVALPICNKDAELAIKHAKWMGETCPAIGYDAVVSADFDTLGNYLKECVGHLHKVFSSVSVFRYQCGSTCSWPHGANVAFKYTSKHMQKTSNGPWLWLEADAVAIRKSWLDELQAAYDIAGKLFMGPIVPGMGHMNGVGIYPKDTPTFIPNALRIENQNLAWDSIMKEEMIWECHNAEPLIQHVWGIVGGDIHPVLGEAPTFDDQSKIERWLKPQAALFHRCKDGSLIDRLLERRSQI